MVIFQVVLADGLTQMQLQVSKLELVVALMLVVHITYTE
jgi:hypothetical protein